MNRLLIERDKLKTIHDLLRVPDERDSPDMRQAREAACRVLLVRIRELEGKLIDDGLLMEQLEQKKRERAQRERHAERRRALAEELGIGEE